MLTRTFENLDIFKKRRESLYKKVENSVFILFSGGESHLSTFRAQSSFVYLTGFEEPEACAVIRTGENPQFTLFVRPKDPSIEIWDGERFGPQKTKEIFQADQTFEITELNEQLKHLLRGCENIYYSIGQDDDQDQLVLKARKQAQMLDRRSGKPQAAIKDPNAHLAGMRMIKDNQEMAWMREACELSARAHLHVMKNVRPGMNERQVQAHLFYSFYDQMAQTEGYSSIIASGANATTLHYRANNRQMEDGDFLLIDAGAEKNYYTADITRTYPVNGRFTKPQKELYQSVLDVQKKLIELVQPGYSLPELQEKAIILLTERMIELGLLSGRVKDLVNDKAYQKYYPHGIGHYLGMDVHDIGLAKINENPVPFEEGVVITVEPGIYIPHDDDSAPKELRGLGVRIEDDILVTANKPEIMTTLVPKEIPELEEIIGK